MKMLFTGAVKSGKSSRALQAAQAWGAPVTFIATAAITDDEIRVRVQRHQAERAALGWETIEEQVEIHKALRNAGDSVLLDCLPMWVNNVCYYKRQHDFELILEDFLDALSQKKNCALVTNETGWGNIPFDEATRAYNMMLANANKKIAAAADTVELLVCGIPVKVK
ncbi:MAG: bifunctional adenosylcobinamide kinase/adenosylcobinamide-phosphate guanylyltransferase [Spirochaetaceae bacterium]|nr:bifunctional adenosylcobinamide kinase/adenosylcobinamide-phosphate guanylyltransferase [Spirochaetaceae bacterium]